MKMSTGDGTDDPVQGALHTFKEVQDFVTLLEPDTGRKVLEEVIEGCAKGTLSLPKGRNLRVDVINFLSSELRSEVTQQLALGKSFSLPMEKECLPPDQSLEFGVWSRLIAELCQNSQGKGWTEVIKEAVEVMNEEEREALIKVLAPDTNGMIDPDGKLDVVREQIKRMQDQASVAGTNPVRVKMEPSNLIADPAPVVKREASSQDIITIDDDDDDQCENNQNPAARIKMESGMTVDAAKFPVRPSDDTREKPSGDKWGPKSEAKVGFIPGSRRVTPGGSVIQVFKRPNRRNLEVDSTTSEGSSPLRDAAAADADKESFVSSASSEKETAGSKRRRPDGDSDPAAKPKKTRESPTSCTDHSSNQSQQKLEDESDSTFSSLSSTDPGPVNVLVAEFQHKKAARSSSGSPRGSQPSPQSQAQSLHKEAIEEPEVIFDECSICGETIPRMMDNPRTAMTHHMAQEHEDIPTGLMNQTPSCSIRCRRCRAYFQDIFLRDLHEAKACTAKECDGCKLARSQSETLLIQHLASDHGEIPPGSQVQIETSDKQCAFCHLWFKCAIFDKFHVNDCVKTSLS